MYKICKKQRVLHLEIMFSYFYIDNHNSYGYSFLRDFLVGSFVFLPAYVAGE